MEKKFYIVGVSFEFEGLFAIVNSILDHVIFAKRNGYIPVIDMKHYKNQYFKDNRVFKENVWEYFFEQPDEYKLEHLNENCDITIGINRIFAECDNAIINEELPKKNFIHPKIENKRQLYKSLFKPNEQTSKFLEENYKKIIGNNKNVLGILCRGTDYLKKRPQGEQIQPSPQMIIKKAKKLLKKNPKISKIYVATEDNCIYQLFKKEFGEMLIENNQYMYDYNPENMNFLSGIKIQRQNHNYNLAKEYLLSIYILSKCKYFIGGRTTGTKWAWILADKWDYCYIWDLGTYGKSPKESLFSITTENINSKIQKVYRIFGIKLKRRVA